MYYSTEVRRRRKTRRDYCFENKGLCYTMGNWTHNIPFNQQIIGCPTAPFKILFTSYGDYWLLSR